MATETPNYTQRVCANGRTEWVDLAQEQREMEEKAAREKREARARAIKVAEEERDLKRREDALNNPPTPAAPAPRVVSHEAISKETLGRICEKRGLKQRQFTDEELKCLKVKKDASKKDIQLLRSRIWDDYLFRAKDSATLRQPVPHFLLLAAREMLEVELFILRNELNTKVSTDKVGELMMKIAELQRDVEDMKTSTSRHQFEEETIG